MVVSGNYCRVVGAILNQAGQTGLQVTGGWCSIENCLAYECAVGFDDDGLETHLENCRSIDHTSTGFDVSKAFGQYETCIATTSQAGTTGVNLSADTADHNHFLNCHTLGNATHGWNVVSGADNNLFSHCSTGAGDGAKADAGANNTWDDFSEGSQIVAGQSRDQDLKDIFAATALASVLGALNTAAATGAVNDVKVAMAYLKQLVTLLLNGTYGLSNLQTLLAAITAAGPTNTQLNTAIGLITAVTNNLPDTGALNDLATILGLVDSAEAAGPYSYTDGGGVQTVKEDTAVTRRRIFLEFSNRNMTLAGTFIIYRQVNGTNYDIWATIAATVAAGDDRCWDAEFTTNQAWKLTYEESADEGAARDIDFNVITKVIE